MHAKDLVVNQRGDRQQVKHAAAIPPGVGVAVLVLALVCGVSMVFVSAKEMGKRENAQTVKAVHLGDLARLVVAAQQHNAVRVFRLERQ